MKNTGKNVNGICKKINKQQQPKNHLLKLFSITKIGGGCISVVISRLLYASCGIKANE